jgi:hypothetical protein
LYVAMQTRNIHKNSLYQGGQMISWRNRPKL